MADWAGWRNERGADIFARRRVWGSGCSGGADGSCKEVVVCRSQTSSRSELWYEGEVLANVGVVQGGGRRERIEIFDRYTRWITMTLCCFTWRMRRSDDHLRLFERYHIHQTI